MTDFAVPPVMSVSSDEVDDDVAFKVLNQDNLPISMVGENILKPFGREHQKHKPNVIVLPTRRVANNLEESKEKLFTKSNGYLNKTERNLVKKIISNSYGNLNNDYKLRIEDATATSQFQNKFHRTLDTKLRRLQNEEKQRRNQNHQQELTPMRKPFVTTVKKGQFLEPPPEIAFLIGMKVEQSACKKDKFRENSRLYAYASRPRVLRAPQKNVRLSSRCEAAAKADVRLIGAVVGIKNERKIDDAGKKYTDVPFPYQNLMFEKRIYRGSNFASQPCEQPKWNPHFAHAKLLSKDEGEGESAAARAAEARRRSLARRKAKNQHIKASQLRLGSPPAVQGRRHERVQTENYLEELFVNPPVTDICTQTDLFLERPVSPFYVPAKTGADADTQIYPGDLFDFDMEVQPILEVLVGKTIEQALIEVLEEEELASLREQQRRFLELRAAETAEGLRLEEREKRLVKEKNRRLAECEEGQRVQQEMEERIAAAVLMQGYMANLLPSVLEGLESDGFLMDSVKKDLDEAFMPWLMREVTNELQDMVSSRDILTDIVKEILENRAEIYMALNKEPIEEADEIEEAPTLDDMALRDHLRLKKEIAFSKESQPSDD